MRSEQLYLTDILEAADAIRRFIAGLDRGEFLQDELHQSAVIQKILVIGEAAGHVSQELRNKYPQVVWPQIVGIRHILVHGYFGIDMEIVWRVAVERVPELREQIAAILTHEFGD